jgi:hypothetical protein
VAELAERDADAAYDLGLEALLGGLIDPTAGRLARYRSQAPKAVDP